MGKYFTATLLFFIFIFIYLLGSFSKIPFGDCIDFALDTEKGIYMNTITPFTHFLYTNTAIFLRNNLHLDSVLACKMMSVFPGALSVSMVYIFVKGFIREDWVAITSTFIFGFSFTFWRSSENLEVYTYNALWVILFFIFVSKSLKTRLEIYIVLAGILLAAAIYSHIQSIMLIPAYFWFLFEARKQKKGTIVSLAIFLMLFLLIFIVNYSKGIAPEYALLTKKGPWIKDTFKQNFTDLTKDIFKSLFYLIYNFNFFSIFGVIGIWHFYKNFKPYFMVFFIAALFIYGFATFYKVSDNYVYFIPFYFLFTLLIATGIYFSSKKLVFQKWSFLCLAIPLFYVSCYKISMNIPQATKFHNEKEYKGGLKYYLLPWLNDNKGCIEFTLEKKTTTDAVEAMKISVNEFVKLRSHYQSINEIKKL